MAYYKNEFDTGFVVDEKTGESTAMLTVGITIAEYRELVERAGKNDAARLADDYWKMRTENIAMHAELAQSSPCQWLDADSISQVSELIKLYRPDIILWPEDQPSIPLGSLLDTMEMFNLSRSTLLYYHRIGLLRPNARSPAGYRLYSDDDKERLTAICNFRQAGLGLEEIRKLLRLEPVL